MEEYHNLFCGGCGGNIGDVLYGSMSGKIPDLDLIFKVNNAPSTEDYEEELILNESFVWDESKESTNHDNYINPNSKFDLAIGKEGGVSFSFIDTVAPFDRIYFEQYDNRKMSPNFFKFGGDGTGMDSNIGESWAIEEKEHIIKWLDNRGMTHHHNTRIFLGLGSGTGGGSVRGFIDEFIEARNNLNTKKLESPFIVGIMPYYTEIDGGLWWSNAATTLLRLSDIGLPIILFDNDEMKSQELLKYNKHYTKSYTKFCESRIRALNRLSYRGFSSNRKVSEELLHKYSGMEKCEHQTFSENAKVGINVIDINKNIANMCKLLYQSSFNHSSRNDSKRPIDEKDISRICTPYDKHNYCVIGTYCLPIKNNSYALRFLNHAKKSNNELLKSLTSMALLTGLSAFCDFRTATSFYWQALVPENYGFKFSDADLSFEWVKDKIKEYKADTYMSPPPQYSVIELSGLPYVQVNILLGGVNVPKVDVLYNTQMDFVSRTRDSPYYNSQEDIE